MGLAWARVLSERQGVRLTADQLARTEATLTWPKAQVRLGKLLRKSGLVHACTDASDGLMAAVAVLAQASRLGTELILDGIAYDPAVERVADAVGIHPWCIARTWGDWQLVCAVAPESADAIVSIAKLEGCSVSVLGSFAAHRKLMAKIGSVRGQVNVLDSERFANAGVPLMSWYPEAVVEIPAIKIPE